MSMVNGGKEKAKKHLEDVLRDAFNKTKQLSLQTSRKATVILALQSLLLIRGGLHPSLFTGSKKLNPYPTMVKYIRASNAETLGALVDDVLRAISPNFITLRSLGELAEQIYQVEDGLSQSTLALLQEETTPLVIMMKKIYQEANEGVDEADTAETQEGVAQ